VRGRELVRKLAAMNTKFAARTGTPRIAIVHEWLTTLGGSELVLKEMLAVRVSRLNNCDY